MKSYTDQYMGWGAAESFAEGLQKSLSHIGQEHLATEGTFLDIGSGDGKLPAEFKKIYPNSKICILTFNIEAARNNNPDADIRNGDFEDMCFDDESISVATSFNIYDCAEECEKPYRGSIQPLNLEISLLRFTEFLLMEVCICLWV